MKLTYHCPLCEKQLKLKREFFVGTTKLFEYQCGHVFSKEVHKASKETLAFNSLDGSGKNAYNYQEDGVVFIHESDFNCIIGDQMRLGKTPQALLALRNAYKERTPALIIVKSANLWQWTREYKTWCDTLPNGIFPIVGSQAWVPPGFSAYIISMDTFATQDKCKCGHRYHEDTCAGKNCNCKVYQSQGNAIIDKLKRIPFKLIIADEAHSFKNTDSNRSQAIVDFISHLNTGEKDLNLQFICSRCKHEWLEQGKLKYDKRIGTNIVSKAAYCPKCNQYCYINQQHRAGDKYVKDPEAVLKIEKCLALSKDQSTTSEERELALTRANELKEKYLIEEPVDKPCGIILVTGTPILNRAEEYFVLLNLINPEKYPSLEKFRREWLQQDVKGRYTRIKEYRLEDFKREIAPYVLRREKEDVFKELPALNKIFTLIEPDKSALASQYNKILDKLEMKVAAKANPSYWDMADDLMELRRICGMMKLMWVADYLEACAMDSSTKYAIGIHHQSVRDVLYMKLGGDKNCFKLSGEDNAERKDWIMQNWEHSDKLYLIINMLAGGVGMDFHYCDNVLILERMWNSALEDQFEFRFYNPNIAINPRPTTAEYVIAKGTLDEWWFQMIEEKRKIFGETVANHWNLETDSMSLKELAEKTIAGRM